MAYLCPVKRLQMRMMFFKHNFLNQELSNGMNSSPVEIFVRRSIENLEEAEIISISPETLNLNKDGAQEKISPRSKNKILYLCSTIAKVAKDIP